MTRRVFLAFLAILTGLLLVFITVPGAGMDAPVGVRITGETGDGMRTVDIPFEILIDYGAFLWGVLPQSDLFLLDQNKIDYQVYESPFSLPMDDGRDSPFSTASPSNFDPAEKIQPDDPGLYLVQFYGPTKDEWRDALEADGVEILQYQHPFTYIVWGSPAILQKSLAQPFVRQVAHYRPIKSMQPNTRISGTDPILVRVIAYQGQDLKALRENFEALGSEWLTQVEQGDPIFNAISLIVPLNQLDEIAALPGIYAVHPLPVDGGNRGEIGNQINAGNINGAGLAFPGYQNWLRTLGLSGSGVTIANVDSGIDESHPDLINRMQPCLGNTCGNNASHAHGTHTAGIMAGDGASGITDSNGFLRGLGMAPGAGLIEQIFKSVWDEPDRMTILMRESVSNNAVISGNSWGPSDIPRGYDYDTRLVDIGVRDADLNSPGNQTLTYILSIMNGNGGFSSQGTPDEAKNILTVGSTYLQKPDGTQDSRKINDISNNSAHGPALDGRKIPHLVAPGVFVDSTYPGDSYGLMEGTSMASPHVTGAVALFYEKYRNQFGVNPSPALVKAAFLPVAHDLAGHHDADGGILGHPFDSKQGWGRLNAGAVLDPPGAVWYFDQETILDHTGATWSTTITTNADSTELRAMLVWTDAPGHGSGGSQPAWVNDLDLAVKVSGQTYFGNQFGPDGYSIQGGIHDGKNNTEGIFLADLPPGEITFTVTAANISGDGVPNFGDGTDQDFALVIYTARTNLNYELIFPIFFR
ncbi:MAG: S8 family serine peptidase [Brevefilum sp.]